MFSSLSKVEVGFLGVFNNGELDVAKFHVKGEYKKHYLDEVVLRRP